MNKSKEKILTMLQQIGYDIEKLSQLNVPELLRKTYSVKVVAVKDGEIGVLSRRIEMQKLDPQKSQDKQNSDVNQLLSVQPKEKAMNNYFYPKYLKSIKKQIDPKDEENKQKLLRWQAEQFEKMKGYQDPQIEDDSLTQIEQQQQQQQSIQSKSLDTFKKKSKKQLPQVRRYQIGQNLQKEILSNRKDILECRAAENLHQKANQKKPSYSRLLADLNEKDFDKQQPTSLVIKNSQRQSQYFSPDHNTNINKDGIIYEQDEEDNQQSPEQMQLKLPKLRKQILVSEFSKSDSDNFQKRLKKIQSRLDQDNQ